MNSSRRYWLALHPDIQPIGVEQIHRLASPAIAVDKPPDKSRLTPSGLV